MEWWFIALLLSVLALVLVGPVSLVAFAYCAFRYLTGEDDYEKKASRWLMVFVLWVVPLIGMIVFGMAPDFR